MVQNTALVTRMHVSSIRKKPGSPDDGQGSDSEQTNPSPTFTCFADQKHTNHLISAADVHAVVKFNLDEQSRLSQLRQQCSRL